MLTVIATFTVTQGKETEFETAFAKLRGATLANESGCTMYLLTRAKKQPGIYKVVEQYADKDAFKAHSASARGWRRR